MSDMRCGQSDACGVLPASGLPGAEIQIRDGDVAGGAARVAASDEER
jgi:hypothetical protein